MDLVKKKWYLPWLEIAMQEEQRRRRERKAVEVGAWVLGRDKVLLFEARLMLCGKVILVVYLRSRVAKTCVLQLNIINEWAVTYFEEVSGDYWWLLCQKHRTINTPKTHWNDYNAPDTLLTICASILAGYHSIHTKCIPIVNISSSVLYRYFSAWRSLVCCEMLWSFRSSWLKVKQWWSNNKP